MGADPRTVDRAGPIAAARRQLPVGPASSRLVVFVAVAVAYALLALSAYELFGALTIGVTFFPPAGLTLALFVLLPRRQWPSVAAAVVVGEVAVDLGQGQGIWWSLGWATANLVEPVVGASIIRTISPTAAFSRRFVLGMLVGCLLIGPACGAAIGAGVLARVGPGAWIDAFSDIWVGDALGVLVVAPLVFVLARPDAFVFRRTELLDTLVVTAITALVTIVLVLVDELPLGYAAIILLVVPAARYSAREVAIAGAVVATVLTASTASGRGPWATSAGGQAHADLVQQQAFLLVALASAWLLKLEVVERIKAVSSAQASEVELATTLEQARQEHRIALTLQQAILPRHLPSMPGARIAARYLPAGEALEVGGDWFDVIADDEGRTLTVVIGDVAGHSLTAAAEMGNLASGCRALAAAGHGPDELIGFLDTMANRNPDPVMTTMVCARIDLAAGRIRYCLAGHPPPLLRDGAGRVVRLDQAGSPPLAIGRPVARPHHDLELPPGATLLFFTDGLVEQRGTDLGGRLLVLEDAFARTGTDPEDVCERLLATMVDAGGNEDDIAVVCVHLS